MILWFMPHDQVNNYHPRNMISTENFSLFIFTTISLIASTIGFILYLATNNRIYDKSIGLFGSVALLFAVIFLNPMFSDNAVYLHNMQILRATGQWPNVSEEFGFVTLISMITKISIDDWIFYQILRTLLVFAKLYIITKLTKEYSLTLIFYIVFIFSYNDIIAIRSSYALLMIYIGLLLLRKRFFNFFLSFTVFSSAFHLSAITILPPLWATTWLYINRSKNLMYKLSPIIFISSVILTNLNTIDTIADYYNSSHVAEKLDFYQYYVDSGETDTVSKFRPVQWYFFSIALLLWKPTREDQDNLLSIFGFVFTLLSPILFIILSYSPVVSGRLHNVYFSIAIFSIIGQSNYYKLLFGIGCLFGFISLFINGHYLR